LLDPAMDIIIHDEKIAVFILSLALAVFVRNIVVSIKMVYLHKKSIYWLNLVQSLLGPVRLLAFLFGYLGVDSDCKLISYFTNYPHEFSMDCISIILTIKAYAGTNRNKLIPVVGALCIAGSIGVHTLHVVNSINEYVKSPFGACGNIPNFVITVIWFAILWFMNMFLTICFCFVIHRHSKFNKSPLFVSLLADGMVYFFLITASNIITPVLILFAVLGANTSIIFDIDWAIQSFLITQQLLNSSSARDAANNPTSHSGNVSSTRNYNSKGLKTRDDDYDDIDDFNNAIMMKQKIEYKVESADDVVVDDNSPSSFNDKQGLTEILPTPATARSHPYQASRRS